MADRTIELLSMALIIAQGGLLAVAGWLVYRRRWVVAIALGALALAGGTALGLASSRYWFGGEAIIDLPFQATLEDLAMFLAALALGGGLAGVVARLAGRASPSRAVGLVGATLVIFAAGGASLWQLSALDDVPLEDPLRRPITIGQGFTSQILEHGTIDRPTALLMSPYNTLIVADQKGVVWSFPFNSDGSLGRPREVTTGFVNPLGLAWHDNELYVSSAGRIDAFTLDDDLKVTGQRVVITGLPALRYVYHQNNQIAFGPDGRLYVGVGSTSNARPEEHPLAAAILSMNPDGSDLRVIATGLRNPFGLYVDATGQLWATENGPAGFDPPPPDELNAIMPGAHYGFPRSYSVRRPEDAGAPPVVNFPPHSAPCGLVAYTGTLFPDEFAGDLFVAGWNNGEIYRVKVQKVGDAFLQQMNIFASGFLNPIALVVDPWGRLVVADYGTRALLVIVPAGG